METETAAQAIDALIRDYSKLVFHVIYGLTGHWEESEDLTQETFLQAFRGIDAARAASGSHFQAKSWLLKIAVNNVRMAQRRKRILSFVSFADLQLKNDGLERTAEGPPAYEAIQELGDDMETVIAERDVVGRCLRQLPRALCAPLLLSTVAGFSSGEIARMLDLKEATVRQRLARARKSFQHLYAHESGEHVSIGEMAVRPALSVIRSRDHRLHRPAALTPAAF